jgi:serine/threonine protein kinase
MHDFLSGRLNGERLTRAEEHVSSCGDCCAAMAALPEDRIAHRLRAHLRDPSAATELPLNAESPAPATQLDDNGPFAGLPDELRDHTRYRIVRLIGEGGMGRVFEAEHRLMERRVAVKFIHRRLLDHPMAAQRFEVEVKAAARLDHPNIVRAYDADHAGGVHFLVMEFVEGASLSRLIEERGPLEPERACQCIRQAAAGLQHAFSRGMVHRDIKPQNLMLSRRGQVKILDFGLARLARELREVRGPATPMTSGGSGAAAITAIGSIVGTPQYIAPEQARDSREVDIRADIYSLGCTLYFLLTGRPPPARFAGPGGPMPPAEAAGLSLPEEIAAMAPELPEILQRMTALDPADRYQTPQEIVDALTPLAKPSDSRMALQATESTASQLPPVLQRVIQRIQAMPRRIQLAGAIGVPAILIAMFVLAHVNWGGTDSDTSTPNRGPSKTPGRFLAAPIGERPGVLFIIPEQFQPEDYQVVRTALEREGIRVRVASTGPCQVMPERTRGMRPVQRDPDLLIGRDPIRAADYSAIYLTGGYINKYKDQTPAREVVWKVIDEAVAANRIVAALGQGQAVLASKGTLVGHTVATNPILLRWMPSYGIAAPGGARVFTDGAFITGCDSVDADEFAKALVRAIRP